MPKEEWGVKRVCPETGKRFYDLNKTPVVSPYTGAVVDVDAETKTNTIEADKEDLSNKPKDDLVDAEDVILDDDTSDVDLGDDVLDDDDDTVPLEEIADVTTNDDDS
ncbi:MAG: TIGR02300 family protein [Rhodobacterales bacterium]|nr:MAG: TIGR02300 family protein [Rhodobacterales bacterium]